MMSFSPEPPRSPATPAPASASTTRAHRGPYLDAVRRAWRSVAADVDPRIDALALALHAFARDGRARGASVESLLRALDRLAHPPIGEPEPGFTYVREWAGTEVIRAYYTGG